MNPLGSSWQDGYAAPAVLSAVIRDAFLSYRGDRVLVAVLKGFFDETGIQKESSLTCVGGFLYEESMAKEFVADWAPRVQGLKKPFHTSPCVAGQKPFEDQNRETRELLLMSLAKITAATRGPGFIASIRREDYQDVVEANAGVDKLLTNSYFLCLMTCINMILKWSEETGFDGLLNLEFEAGGPKYQKISEFMKLIEEHPQSRIGRANIKWSFSPKRLEPLFAPPDLLVWEWQHNINNKGEEFTPRMKMLIEDSSAPLHHTQLNKEQIKIQAAFNGFYDLYET